MYATRSVQYTVEILVTRSMMKVFIKYKVYANMELLVHQGI